jgi:[citrate (pro-3S)-lyase] ligase
MSWADDYEIRSLSPNVSEERAPVEALLADQDLTYEDDIDYTIGLFRDHRLIATGSLAGGVIKAVATAESARGENLTATVLSYLKLNAYHRGIESLFLYTSPGNREFFTSAGYTVLVETERALLLEDNKNTFRFYLDALREQRRDDGVTAAIVMNCNPFTVGHRYLIERTAEENDHVVVFVVEEDRSVFPFDVRMNLIRKGVADLKNVTVVPGGRYIISNATFPSYFLKESKKVNEAHAEVDLTLFGREIASAVGITKRYVGHEPYCPVTSMYNETMKRLLPEYGVEVVEIQRKDTGGVAISASEVRRRIADGLIDSIAEIVPKSTYDYLVSPEAAPIVTALQGERE